MKRLTLLLAIPLLGVTLLQGCAPVIVGGAATGVSTLHDRRSAGTVLDDQAIELKAMNLLNKTKDLKERNNFTATSYNKVVLLTGQAASERDRRRYEELIRSIEGVRRIVNEIQIGANATLSEHTKDAYITSKVKLELFKIKLPDFDPTRVKVVTEKGVVYLMGLLRPNEADAVVEKVRFISGITQVVKVFEYL